MKKLKFIFAVQGEGRGHLTQAIALQEILKKNGHEVSAVIAGKSSRRSLPEFFSRKIDGDIIQVPSPNFITDQKDKSIDIIRTIWNNSLHIGQYWKSVSVIRSVIEEHQPDAIINFYEPLMGLYNLRYRHRTKMISLAHQYIYLHPEFEFPKEKILDRAAIKIYTKLTAYGSDLTLALSTYSLPEKKEKKLFVTPPLLRSEIFNQQAGSGDFLLVYLVNSGYMDDVIQWHHANKHIRLHCFTDSKRVNGELPIDDTLVFHSLDDQKFLSMMSKCKGLVCTAGFESVCEAMYLEKPVMMIPVKGHFEQYCNARDAFKAGAGIYDDDFNISRFVQYLPYLKESRKNFREWVNSMESRVMQAIYQTI